MTEADAAGEAAEGAEACAAGWAGEPTLGGARDEQRKGQCGLLRDLFGNPFLPPSGNPAWADWRGGLIVVTARRLYEARDFAGLPELGDMLQEAGCPDRRVLAHCRQQGEHARGCHVLDLVLGQE